MGVLASICTLKLPAEPCLKSPCLEPAMVRHTLLIALRPVLLGIAALVLGAGAAQAAVCLQPGFAVGCTVGAPSQAAP